MKLVNINKIYLMGEEKVAALKNINLSIEQGEFVSIMGPSGSGKSTMLQIMGCLDRASNGEYLLNGKDVRQLHVNKLSEIRNDYLGFIFQSFNLLPDLNLIKNVEIPLIYAGVSRKKRKYRAVRLLSKMGLENRLKHKPSELSGGQRQRVAIARALVNQPKVIFADEPTGNLDSQTSIEIMDILKDLNNQGVTVVLVTHDNELNSYANKKIILRDGQLMVD